MLLLDRGLSNQNRSAGKEARFKCSFRCSTPERCDLKHVQLRWLKNEAPLKSRKAKVELRTNRAPTKLTGKTMSRFFGAGFIQIRC